jgi:2-polyprenyl-6-methoxyphenol hydroxylase-like FAD-dependent oxidoreductase
MMPKSNHLAIGIVGAGTAGLASAIALARLGHAVTVYEKHRSLSPLGAGLLIQPQGVAAFEALGVGPAFHAASVPVTRLLGTCHRNWTLVDIPYDATEARGVSRAALSEVLLSRALTPCFQADSNGLWRDLMFAIGLKLPGIQRLMYPSIAAPKAAHQQRSAQAVGALRRD